MTEINEETLVHLELEDEIVRRIEIYLNQGIPGKKAVRLGVYLAIEKWKENNVNKSGG